MLTLIKGGRVIDPGRLDGFQDILVADEKILEIVPSGSAGSVRRAQRIIDASGRIVSPGLIDMHVHLRQPGFEYKETIASGCRAAARGGFTAVCAMANTRPVNDSRAVTEYILEKAAEAKMARVYPVAAVSHGLQGRHLCEFDELQSAGAVAVSDDGNPVADSRLMRSALEIAGQVGMPVISHCEDPGLAAGGVMNAGPVARRLGLPGIPNTCESVMVMRDIALCELTGAALHIAHVSCQESVRAIRAAKKRSVPVTAETAPHYFTLTDEAVAEYQSLAKMNPPLRSARDRDAIRDGLADGTIDVIASDHAPHAAHEKNVPFEQAANGIIGLETSLALSLKLVHDGVLGLEDMLAKMATRPTEILGLPGGLQPGNAADITIIDPDLPHTVTADNFQSLGRNTPFDGWQLAGRAVLTMVAGQIIFAEKINIDGFAKS